MRLKVKMGRKKFYHMDPEKLPQSLKCKVSFSSPDLLCVKESTKGWR